jgi:Zn-dependent protease/CBS domain-containing protein
MAGTFKLGRLLGIEIRLHWSWAFIFALVTFSFAEGVVRDAFPGWQAALRWPAGAVVGLVFFASLLAHEMAHSVVARRLGIPVSSITLFIFGGSSNLTKDPESARQEVEIAVVGPLTSFVMAAVFGAGYAVLVGTESDLSVIARDLAIFNVAIGVFNLIPAFPMDGGRLLRGLLKSSGRSNLDATRLATAVGEGFAVLFMAIGALALLFVDLVSGVWLLLIGNFMRGAAAESYQQVVLDKLIKNVPVSIVARGEVETVPPTLTLEELVHDYFLAGRGRCMPVVSGGELLGLIALSDVRKVPRESWPSRTVVGAMTPLQQLETVGASDDVAAVLEIMAAKRLNQVPVIDGRRLVGMVERSDVIAYIQTQQELTDLTGQPPQGLAAAKSAT